ncbi:hypothetical protein KFK09_005461 [Dendrobium nobile]|uniref:Uncharacterized protein n=1 Tax=Dendrobium nobile TaxID=94219 RepID=A0A8T3BYG6_DENNO|nr:hypothetical protein KFK09_005461 [Dendrobium nobile]
MTELATESTYSQRNKAIPSSAHIPRRNNGGVRFLSVLCTWEGRSGHVLACTNVLERAVDDRLLQCGLRRWSPKPPLMTTSKFKPAQTFALFFIQNSALY